MAGYVAAAYLVVALLVGSWLAIMARRSARLEREVADAQRRRRG